MTKFAKFIAMYVKIGLKPGQDYLTPEECEAWAADYREACATELNVTRGYKSGRGKEALRFAFESPHLGNNDPKTMPSMEDIKHCVLRDLDLVAKDNKGQPIKNPTAQDILEKSTDGHLWYWYCEKVIAAFVGILFKQTLRRTKLLSDIKAEWEGGMLFEWCSCC